MKKLMSVIVFAMLVMSSNVHACEIRGTGLPAEAVARLKVACEEAKLAQISTESKPSIGDITSIDPDTVTQIGRVSVEIAKALGLAARELGIEANKFIQTPAGILVVIGVFWTLFMSQLLGIALIIMTLWLMIKAFRRLFTDRQYYTDETLFWGLVTYKKTRFDYSAEISSDQFWSGVLITIIATIIIVVVIANLLV